jgi:methylated-DNA-[protein]-cysteine S-methyltransferase
METKPIRDQSMPSARRTISWDVYESPLGELALLAGFSSLRGLRFPGDPLRLEPRDREAEALAGVTAQLTEYFAGERRRFDLELDLGPGTAFELSVWNELRRIPYGETVSYMQLAEAVGRPDRVRAVGGVVGRTPIPIVIPCHRVIGSDGTLTGYGGGLDRKEALLTLERQVSAGLAPEPAWAFRQAALL